MYIRDLEAYEVLDSRGIPTVEVVLTTDDGQFFASSPSGTSTGIYEFKDNRDNGDRVHGFGVKQACRKIRNTILPAIRNAQVHQQRNIDTILFNLDRTVDLSILGANSISAVSMAVCRAGASYHGIEVHEYINLLLHRDRKTRIPQIAVNVVNGGAHTVHGLACQEIMVVPQFSSYHKNLDAATEIYLELEELIERRFGPSATNHGLEGGYTPVTNIESAIKCVYDCIVKLGYKGQVGIALDMAASSFSHVYADGHVMYHCDGEKTVLELTKFYQRLIKKYPIISIEDPFHEEYLDDFNNLHELTGSHVVTDDATVTDPERLELAIQNHAGTACLIKINQAGTVTRALDCARLAYDHRWHVIVSHRSGETDDPFVAELAVGVGAHQAKFGAPSRERIVKYNHLTRLNKMLR